MQGFYILPIMKVEAAIKREVTNPSPGYFQYLRTSRKCPTDTEISLIDAKRS